MIGKWEWELSQKCPQESISLDLSLARTAGFVIKDCQQLSVTVRISLLIINLYFHSKNHDKLTRTFHIVSLFILGGKIYVWY